MKAISKKLAWFCLAICLLIGTWFPALAQLRPVGVAQIKALARAGHWDSLASAITALPASITEKSALLRNEFVLAALFGQASEYQIAQAVEFYRADLTQRGYLLANIPEQSVASILEQTPPETLHVYQEILSSAGALAALGSAQDADVLVDFWKNSGPFKEVATNITGRGLLRFGAYDEFNKWASTAQPSGEVWLGFEAYFAKHKMPSTFTIDDPYRLSSLPKKQLSVWLGEGCAVNATNAAHNPAGAEMWAHELGRDSFLLKFIIETYLK